MQNKLGKHQKMIENHENICSDRVLKNVKRPSSKVTLTRHSAASGRKKKPLMQIKHTPGKQLMQKMEPPPPRFNVENNPNYVENNPTYLKEFNIVMGGGGVHARDFLKDKS